MYKPKLDARSQRPQEQALQGKDIARIADGQEKSNISIEALIKQQKKSNGSIETGFDALMKSQKTGFIKRNLDNVFEILTTRKEGKRAYSQREGYQKEHIKDDKIVRKEFKTSDKKQDLDYVVQRHQEDTGEEQITVLGKIANSFAGKAQKQAVETLKRSELAKAQHRNKMGQFAKQSAEEAAEEKLLAQQEKLSWMKFYTRWEIFGDDRMTEAIRLSGLIEKQSEHMEKIREGQEKIGVSVDNPVYRKEELKLQKLERDRAKTTGSKEAEKTAKARIKELKSQTVLSKMAKGIGSMVGFMGKAGKSIAGKLPSIGALMLTGAAIGLMLLKGSPLLKRIQDYIINDVIPIVGDWIENTLIPTFKKLKTFLETASFDDIVDGTINLFKDIMTGIFSAMEGIVRRSMGDTIADAIFGEQFKPREYIDDDYKRDRQHILDEGEEESDPKDFKLAKSLSLTDPKNKRRRAEADAIIAYKRDMMLESEGEAFALSAEQQNKLNELENKLKESEAFWKKKTGGDIYIPIPTKEINISPMDLSAMVTTDLETSKLKKKIYPWPLKKIDSFNWDYRIRSNLEEINKLHEDLARARANEFGKNNTLPVQINQSNINAPKSSNVTIQNKSLVPPPGISDFVRSVVN